MNLPTAEVMQGITGDLIVFVAILFAIIVIAGLIVTVIAIVKWALRRRRTVPDIEHYQPPPHPEPMTMKLDRKTEVDMVLARADPTDERDFIVHVTAPGIRVVVTGAPEHTDARSLIEEINHLKRRLAVYEEALVSTRSTAQSALTFESVFGPHPDESVDQSTRT